MRPPAYWKFAEDLAQGTAVGSGLLGTDADSVSLAQHTVNLPGTERPIKVFAVANFRWSGT